MFLSNTKTGQIDHRTVCGNQFSVKEGRVSRAAKAYSYTCPFCNGEAVSHTKTGQINHRSVCGNQFYVKEGRVSSATRRHAHACPVCRSVVWSSRSFGEIHVNHDTPAGKPCKTTKWHVRAQKTETKRWREARVPSAVRAGFCTWGSCLGWACRGVWGVKGVRKHLKHFKGVSGQRQAWTPLKAHGPGVWPLVFSGRAALDGPAGSEIGFGKACGGIWSIAGVWRQANGRLERL